MPSDSPAGHDVAPPRADDECHIVGLVVHVHAAQVLTAAAVIRTLDDAQIEASDGAGRFVVVLEAHDEARILAAIGALENITGVLSVTLAYHEIDTA